MRYIITVTYYLTRWEEVARVMDCTTATAARFLFDNIVKQFGCLRILMSDQGSRFINCTVSALTKELQIQHNKSTPYHPQENGTVEVFNKILEHALTKVCNANHDDWDLKILAMLWEYCTTCEKLLGQTPFKLVYGKEAVMPMEYIVPSLHIFTTTGMDDEVVLEEGIE